MTGMLELAEQEFKITRINMPRALIDKVGSMQQLMGNISRKMKILRKKQKINDRDKKTL